MERLGNNANGEDTAFACCTCHNRSGTCTGATAHACRYEAHMRAVKMIDDFIDAFFSGCAANFWLGASTEAFGDSSAKLDHAFRL